MAPATAPSYSNAQLLAMPWATRSRILAGLSSTQRSSYQTALNNQNFNYFRQTFPQWAPVPAAGGGYTTAFAAGQQLTFNVATAMNAFIEGYIVRFVGTLNPATGTAAAYAKNAGAPLNLIDNIQVIYGNVVHNYRPYILRQLEMLSGQYQPPVPSTVLVGQTVTSVQTYLNGGQAITVNTNNTWDFNIFVPMNIHRSTDWHGWLPTMGGETQLQILITCATTVAVGNDPILNVLSAVSGSGHAVVVTGNFSVIAQYRDGRTRRNVDYLRFDVAGQASMRFVRDQLLVNITGGSIYRGTIATRSGNIPWVILTLVDGNQATKFAADSNIQVIEEDVDAVGNNRMWSLGTGSNLQIYEYMYRFRRILNQDIDEGIWPVVHGPINNVPDANNQDGSSFLSTAPTGIPDWHYGVQFATVSGLAGIVPRVESHVIAWGGALRVA